MTASLEKGLYAILDLRLKPLRNLSGLIEADNQVDEQLGIVPGGGLGRHVVGFVV